MRVLRFIVNDQIIERDSSCDFSNLVPGSEGYVIAEFSFSPEWSKCTAKVASFWSLMGGEYTPQLLDSKNRCLIPAEALARRQFKVKVMGKTGDVKIATNKVTVSQTGGKV